MKYIVDSNIYINFLLKRINILTDFEVLQVSAYEKLDFREIILPEYILFELSNFFQFILPSRYYLKGKTAEINLMQEAGFDLIRDIQDKAILKINNRMEIETTYKEYLSLRTSTFKKLSIVDIFLATQALDNDFTLITNDKMLIKYAKSIGANFMV
ncbi:MAG: PIN domain-containing protein [bacterium]